MASHAKSNRGQKRECGSSALDRIATTIAGETFTAIYVRLILVALGLCVGCLLARIAPLWRALSRATKALRNLEGKEGVGRSEALDSIGPSLTTNKYLKDYWLSYSQSLRTSSTEGPTSTTSARAFFDPGTLLQSRLATGWWSALPNLFTGAGILGTFLGLWAGIYRADLGQKSASTDELRSSIGSLLDGASLAFATSIAGLVASIVFTIFHRWSLRLVERRADYLATKLDSLLPPPTHESLASQQLDLQREQVELLKKFNTEFAIQLGNLFDQKVQPGLHAIHESLVTLRQDQGRASEEALTAIAGQFQEALSAATGDQIQNIAETLFHLDQTLTTSTSAFTKATSAWESALIQTTDSIGKLEDFATTLAMLHGSLQETLRHTAACVSTAGTTLEQFGRLSTAVKATTDRFSEIVQQLLEVNQQNQQQWTSYITRFEETDRKLAETFRQLDQGWKSYGQQIRSYLTELDDHTGDALENLGNVINQIHEAMEELPERVRELEEALRSREEAA